MTGLAVLGVVGVAVLGLVGLGVVVWGWVEGWRERDRARRHRQYCERRRIEREAQAVAGRLEREAFRIRADMLRHAVQRMDRPQHPHRRPGGRHG